MTKYTYIDFEFNSTQEYNINLVCCCMSDNEKNIHMMPLRTTLSPHDDFFMQSIWLLDSPDAKEKLKQQILSMKDTHTFVSYSVEAEARSFLALGLNPVEFTWIDLYIEYLLATNHSTMSHGKHYDTKSRVIRNYKSPVKLMEERGCGYYEAKDILKDDSSLESGRISHGLNAAMFKLLSNDEIQITGDGLEKKEVRDIIIAGDKENILLQQKRILDYCASDVVYLPLMREKLEQKLSKNNSQYLQEAKLRAEYAARTAVMVQQGYPIDIEALKLFTKNVPTMMNDCRIDINKTLRDNGILEPFFQDKKGVWHMKEKVIKDYFKSSQDISNWPKTPKGDLKMDAETLEKRSGDKHDYKPTLISQLVRWSHLESSLRGFDTPTKATAKTIFSYIGSDNRVRPYFGIFGSQSSRSQPAATGYIFLKSAWIRALVQPPRGKVIIGNDYMSQEFLLSALISKDKAMQDAYNSGDVYLKFACQSGQITEAMPAFKTKEYDEFKKKYAAERDACKSLVLGLSYMMGAPSLAAKLTNDSKVGRIFTEEEAIELRQTFRDTYPDFIEWQEELIRDYKEYREPIVLPCGWRMFGQNPNHRSVGNFPLQGAGASIMRKAVALCQDAGLNVIMTLHDCVYIEEDLTSLEASSALLQKCMVDAFDFYFPNSGVKGDVKYWGFGTDNEYQIDSRGIAEWIKYYKYVMPSWVPSEKEMAKNKDLLQHFDWSLL